MVYLDHNATTIIHPIVAEQIAAIMGRPFNPSSIHTLGREGKFLLETARLQIAVLLGINLKEYEIIFTSSGTEANNLILSNFREYDIFISAIEHVSVFDQQQYLPNVQIIKAGTDGIVDLEDLETSLKASNNSKKLVSIMLANNETGVIQPLKGVRELAHYYEALLHTDCVQALGKIPVNLQELDVDFATISGHKFGGPLGAGALIKKLKIPIKPQIIGGGQERGLRAGTENVMAIVGLGLAAAITRMELASRHARMKRLQEKLERELTNIFPEIIIAGAKVERLPNTSLIMKPRSSAQMQLIAFDLKNIAVSSGSACSSGKVGTSHVLRAMNFNEEEAKSAIRISTGFNQPEEDIDKFIDAYKDLHLNK